MRLTSDVSTSEGDQTDQTYDLVPVIGANGDTKAPAGREFSRLSWRLPQGRQMDVRVQVESFGGLEPSVNRTFGLGEKSLTKMTPVQKVTHLGLPNTVPSRAVAEYAGRYNVRPQRRPTSPQ